AGAAVLPPLELGVVDDVDRGAEAIGLLGVECGGDDDVGGEGRGGRRAVRFGGGGRRLGGQWTPSPEETGHLDDDGTVMHDRLRVAESTTPRRLGVERGGASPDARRRPTRSPHPGGRLRRTVSGRSPGSRISLLPDLPARLTPILLDGARAVACPGFVPGYSGGGRAGIAPASLFEARRSRAGPPHRRVVKGPARHHARRPARV